MAVLQNYTAAEPSDAPVPLKIGSFLSVEGLFFFFFFKINLCLQQKLCSSFPVVSPSPSFSLFPGFPIFLLSSLLPLLLLPPFLA